MDSEKFTEDELNLVAQVFDMAKISPLQPNAITVCQMSQTVLRKMHAHSNVTLKTEQDSKPVFAENGMPIN